MHANDSRKRFHALWPLSLAMLVICGCSGTAGTSNEPLNYQQVDAGLIDPKLRNIAELFKRLSEEPIREIVKASLADVDKKKSEFQTLGDWMENEFQNERDKGDVENRRTLTKSIHWKGPEASLAEVSRVYIITSHYPSEAKRLATWDSLVAFYVFTDNDGKIMGWQRSILK